MIREAVRADIPGLVAMGRQFHAMSPHAGMGEYDEQAVARMLGFMIDTPSALILTNGAGAIGGVLSPVYFRPGKLMMEESFWWAAKGGRDLLRAFVDEAQNMGASFVLLSTLENDRNEVVDRVVRRMGFQPVERRYLREL